MIVLQGENSRHFEKENSLIVKDDSEECWRRRNKQRNKAEGLQKFKGSRSKSCRNSKKMNSRIESMKKSKVKKLQEVIKTLLEHHWLVF